MEPLQCTATLPRGRRRSNCYNALPQYLGVGGSATTVMHCHTAGGAVGTGFPAMRRPSTYG